MRLRLHHVLLAVPVLFIWFWTWLYLSSEWSANEQYRFGFAVPPLALFLAFRNWPASMPDGTKRWIAFYVIAWPVLLLAEMLRLSDPLWRLTGGLWMIGATFLTVGYLAQLGGWFLVRRMTFPLCFLWVGLPWPMPLENQIIQTMTRVVTAVTTTIMNFAGVAALQRGNTIELANQVVGIDAACTGIESFQASLMASLFLWGLMRLRPAAGLMLVVGSIVGALFVNLWRVVVITWSAHELSHENQAVHDWVGGVATILIFGTIFFVAKWLDRRNARSDFDSPIVVSSSGSAPATSRWASAVACAVLFLGIPFLGGRLSGITEQTKLSDQPRWQIKTDRLPEEWTAYTLDPTSAEKSVLRFSRWTALQIRTSDGLWANIVHLFWNKSWGMPSIAFYHTPALCMPSAGWQTVGEPRTTELERDGKPLRFANYVLVRDQDHVVALQYLIRGDQSSAFQVESTRNSNRFSRFAQLWRHSSEAVREEILIYLPYVGSDEASMKFAEAIVSTVVQPTGR
jgi:exosortase